MQTRPLDPTDDEQLRAFYDVGYRAEMEDGRPWNGHWTFDEVASMIREQTPDDQVLAVCAYDAESLVGAGLVMYSLVDNTDKAYLFAMVDPPSRGRGAGGALLEALVEQCRERGRTTVTSNAAYAGPERADAEAVRFAARHGFRIASTEIHRHLRGTYVSREHRGHRLGAAVKVANLRSLQAVRPDVTRIDTGNADTNRFMVSINERLGFEVAAAGPSFVRNLGA